MGCVFADNNDDDFYHIIILPMNLINYYLNYYHLLDADDAEVKIAGN